MRFLPVGLDLRDRPCVVLGGGVVGARKVRSLLRAGARVTVVAPEVTDDLSAEIDAGRVHWSRAEFQPAHIDGARLVVIATSDPAANELAARLARRRGSLVCDATSAERSDVIFGALHEQSDVTISVFTDGRSPGRARQTRDAIAHWLTHDHPPANGGPAVSRDDAMLVLVAHGSRDPDWGLPLEELTEAIGRTAPEQVRLAYSQFASPTIRDVAVEAARSGIRRFHVLPLFMTSGGHVERDIRPIVDAVRREHPEMEVELLPPVGELPAFRTFLERLAREVTR